MTIAVDEGVAVFTERWVGTADWFRESWYSPTGALFEEISVPWITAPQGPCWAYDQPQFSEIWLMWAARMFKTNFALGTLMRQADLSPCDMMFASPDETNCKQVYRRWWKMLGFCPPLRDQYPPEREQNMTHITLGRCEIYAAWPRGKSRLADKSIRFGHANEVDKWEQPTTSTEGDPLARFTKRGAEYPDRKFIYESTPGTQGASRVEPGFESGTRHRYYVPCPHCSKFQIIRFGDEGQTAGCIVWDKPTGKSDPDTAAATARYVCEQCETDIDDSSRHWMMSNGVWVPDGCEPDHDRAFEARELPPDDRSWLRGEQLVDGNRYSSHINSFYALFTGWGRIAKEFLEKRRNIGTFRQWVNEDKAETWKILIRTADWQEVAARIIHPDAERGTVPGGFNAVTIGVDQQQGFWKWLVVAWKPDRSGHVVDYGESDTTEQLREVIERDWAAGEDHVRAAWTMIDSNYRPGDVHDFVRECRQAGLNVRACRGSHGRPIGAYYRSTPNSNRSSHPGVLVTTIDTHSTQDWAQKLLTTVAPGDPGALTVYHGTPAQHQPFIEELLNEQIQQSLDSRNYVTETWNRVDDSIPNDWRDCLRYAFVAYLVHERSGRRTPPRKSGGGDAGSGEAGGRDIGKRLRGGRQSLRRLNLNRRG